MDRLAALTELLGGEDKLPKRIPQPTSTTISGESSADAAEVELVDAFGNVRVNPVELPTLDSFLKSEEAKVAAAGVTRTGVSSKAKSDDSIGKIDGRFGEPSNTGIAFCPFLAISKFPYRFVNDLDLRQPLATDYFDRDQIYEREWDHYFVDARYSPSGKCITMVPKTQVEALITEMNAAYPKLKWQFEQQHDEWGLVVTFDHADAELRPRFLGHCNSRAQYNLHTEHTFTEAGQSLPVKRDVPADFQDRVKLMYELGKNNWKGGKAGKSQRTAPRGPADSADSAQPVPSRVNVEHVKDITKAQQYLGLKNPTFTTAFPDVIFISIDVEAWEEDHNIVTEVGVATLDTRDVHPISPGKNGEKWHSHIRARHFRIKENMDARYTNHKYIQGCPDSFRFGNSEIVSRHEIASVLTACFHHPFSFPTARPDIQANNDEVRQIVLLGHDIETDINYCHKMGFSVTNRGNLVDIMDTASIYRHYKKEANPRKLGSVLEAFDLEGWSLHNAGNDAVYTVQAMLALCIAETSIVDTSMNVQDSTAKVAVMFGPPRPPDMSAVKMPQGGNSGPPKSGFFTMGGVPLDV